MLMDLERSEAILGQKQARIQASPHLCILPVMHGSVNRPASGQYFVPVDCTSRVLYVRPVKIWLIEPVAPTFHLTLHLLHPAVKYFVNLQIDSNTFLPILPNLERLL